MARTDCCIAGGGPAGMMLGLLLARAGLDVTVLEKHEDFFRDFRGDTIHPSTLELMNELGVLDGLLQIPHTEIASATGIIGNVHATLADFSHLPTRCKFIALMPQWDFLNFIRDRAREYSGFHLLMRAEATGLLEENGRVAGVSAKRPEGTIGIEARLTIGADGRHSAVRRIAGLELEEYGAPMDVLWMRISRLESDENFPLGVIRDGTILVMLNRREYWQCALVINKGAFAEMQGGDITAFQNRLRTLMPAFGERVTEVGDWSKVQLLTVRVDRLKQWFRSGLLCIGDAAHAMSPIGGVGINLAIQDAVATANILARPLRTNSLRDADLRAVQRRREFPAKATQALQLFLQNRVVEPVITSGASPQTLPIPVALLKRFPYLRRIPARVIGLGFRPEHIAT